MIVVSSDGERRRWTWTPAGVLSSFVVIVVSSELWEGGFVSSTLTVSKNRLALRTLHDRTRTVHAAARRRGRRIIRTRRFVSDRDPLEFSEHREGVLPPRVPSPFGSLVERGLLLATTTSLLSDQRCLLLRARALRFHDNW